MLCLVLPSRSSSSTFPPSAWAVLPTLDIANGLVYPCLLRFVFNPPRGRHRLVSTQSITPPHHLYTGNSLLLRHFSGPSPPLHPHRIATFTTAGSPHLLVNLRGPSTPPHPHRIATLLSQRGLHPPSYNLTACFTPDLGLHPQDQQSSPCISHRALHTHFHGCHKRPQQSLTLASLLSTDGLRLRRLELTLGYLLRLRLAP